MFSSSTSSSSPSRPPPAPIPAPYPFQTYILPTQPFHRRRSSTRPSASPPQLYPSLSHLSISPSQESSSSYTPSSSSRSPHQRPRRSSYLQNHTSHISCARCKASLALSSQIISKGFTGRHGRALLVSPSEGDTIAVPPTSPSSRRKSSRAMSNESRDGGTSGNGPNQDQAHMSSSPLQPPAPTRRRSSALSNAFSAALGLASSPFSPMTTNTSTTPHPSTSTSGSGSWLSRSLSSTTTSPPSSSTSTSPASPSSFRSSSSHHKPPTSTPPTTLPNTHTHPAVPRHLVTGLHVVADVSCTVCSSVLGWKYISTEEEAQRYKVGKYILECKRVVLGSEWEGGGGVFEFEKEEEDGESEGGKGEGQDDGVDDVNEEEHEGIEQESEPDEDDEEGEVTSQPYRILQGGTTATATATATTLSTLPPQFPSQHNTRIRWTDSVPLPSPLARKRNEYDHEGYSDDDEVLFDSQDEDECDDLFAGMWNPQVARLRRDSKRRDSARVLR